MGAKKAVNPFWVDHSLFLGVIMWKLKNNRIVLIRNQLTWLNLTHNKALVLRKAEKIYNLYMSGELDEKIKRRCCNFKKLQDEYMNYQL